MNLIERAIVRIFRRTFEKVYRMGLTDSFNFCNSSSYPQNINCIQNKRKSPEKGLK